MAERNLDFDTYVDRRNTDCLKYDLSPGRLIFRRLPAGWSAITAGGFIRSG